MEAVDLHFIIHNIFVSNQQFLRYMDMKCLIRYKNAVFRWSDPLTLSQCGAIISTNARHLVPSPLGPRHLVPHSITAN